MFKITFMPKLNLRRVLMVTSRAAADLSRAYRNRLSVTVPLTAVTTVTRTRSGPDVTQAPWLNCALEPQVCESTLAFMYILYMFRRVYNFVGQYESSS